MKSFSDYINEARRESSKNPRVSAYEQLLPYKDRDDIYISFTKLPKIGINPGTQWDTPIGVYTYPLKEFWLEYNVDKEKSIGAVAPFAGDAPYIQVIQAKHSKNFIDLAKLKPTDIKKLIDAITDKIKGPEDKEEVIANLEYAAKNPLVKSIGGRWWAVLHNAVSNLVNQDVLGLPPQTAKGYSILSKRLGFTGYADKKGQGIIHRNEPLQAVFIDSREYKHLKTIDNKDYDLVGQAPVTSVYDSDEVEGIVWDSKKILKVKVFDNGTFNQGTFIGDRMINTKFLNGVFSGKEFISGVFNGGKFKRGKFIDSNFFDGEFLNGIFEVGSWFVGGTFSGGEFRGTWQGGKWAGGKWSPRARMVSKGDMQIFSKKYNTWVYSTMAPPDFYKEESASTSVGDLVYRVEAGQI